MLKEIVVFLFAIISTSLSIDYCAESLCDGLHHIACKNTGKFGPQCPSNAVNHEFTDKLKELVLSDHNKYRDQIARGTVKHFEKAARMATLVWDDELAKLAEYNARTCTFGHDECRNTALFNYAGQNLGQMKSSLKFPTPEKVIETVIKGWFDEYNVCDMSYIDKFRHHDSGEMIGHFTQLIRDEAYAVGCALVQFKEAKWYTSLFACDYTLTNIQDLPIYDKSSVAGSGCKTGTNKEFKGLCSTKEIYKNSTFYST